MKNSYMSIYFCMTVLFALLIMLPFAQETQAQTDAMVRVSEGTFIYDLPASWRPMSDDETNSIKQKYEQYSRELFSNSSGDQDSNASGVSFVSGFTHSIGEAHITTMVVKSPPNSDQFLSDEFKRLKAILKQDASRGAFKRLVSHKKTNLNFIPAIKTELELNSGALQINYLFYMQEQPEKIFVISLRAGADKAAKYGSIFKKMLKYLKITHIAWRKYDQGLAEAKNNGKNIFVEFTTGWCGYCKKMHASTFMAPEVIEILNDKYVPISIDAESYDTLNIDGWITNGRAVAKEFGVKSYPTYWLLSSDQEKLAPVIGYKDKPRLMEILDYLKDDLYKTVKFDEFMKQKNPGR